MNTIFTIGHSTNTNDQFIKLLSNYQIDCIIDVRSTPFSRIVPHFNKNPLRSFLQKNHVRYAHFAEEFGARRIDPKLLDDDGIVDFSKVRNYFAFLHGIDRVLSGLGKGYNIGLMCSESNPFICHRFGLISYDLNQKNITIKHILRSGDYLTNQQLEDKLIKNYAKQGLQNSFFDQPDEQSLDLNTLYQIHNKKIGYSAFSQDMTL